MAEHIPTDTSSPGYALTPNQALRLRLVELLVSKVADVSYLTQVVPQVEAMVLGSSAPGPSQGTPDKG